MSNFTRFENLIGKDSIDKLRNSHVLVLGLGGVGGYAFRNYTYKEELQQKQQQLDDTNALLEKENQKLFSLPTK